jgi:HEPN domain-containing protein
MTIQQTPNVRVWSQGEEYVKAAELLLEHYRLQPAVVLSALALEVFVKSLLATRLSSGHAITEQGHGLLRMLDHAAPDVREQLLECSAEIDAAVDLRNRLQQYDRSFVDVRYWYEPSAPRTIGSDIVHFARHVCDAVFLLGQRRGV